MKDVAWFCASLFISSLLIANLLKEHQDSPEEDPYERVSLIALCEVFDEEIPYADAERISLLCTRVISENTILQFVMDIDFITDRNGTVEVLVMAEGTRNAFNLQHRSF